jgi:hypothetical protein
VLEPWRGEEAVMKEIVLEARRFCALLPAIVVAK